MTGVPALGNLAEAYGRAGQNHFTFEEVLTPLKATAHRSGLPWYAPRLLFAADKLAPIGWRELPKAMSAQCTRKLQRRQR
ncbi:hypothetical protein [Sulfitobacter sp.]|uniref:hypothetical protein n=1 Tax=Sulfitobacter sp. TaxID=1903071 RepID=UPI00300119C1